MNERSSAAESGGNDELEPVQADTYTTRKSAENHRAGPQDVVFNGLKSPGTLGGGQPDPGHPCW